MLVCCTRELVCLICSMRATLTSPRHVKWSKNKVRGGMTSVWQGTRGLLASQTSVCVCVCVPAVFLLWPLSSNVLMLNLTSLGTSAGHIHTHIQKRHSWAARLYSQSVDTHENTQTQSSRGFKHLQLTLSIQTCSQISCGQTNPNHILKHAGHLAYM